MTRRSRHMRKLIPFTQSCTFLALIMLLGVGASACSDRTTPPRPPTYFGGGGPDAGFVADAAFDEPIRSLCLPGTQQCLGENSPLYEVCRDDGDGYTTRTCEDGEVCRQRRCVPFHCTPGRPLCLGATTRAICDDTGQGVIERAACEDGTACRGGTCVDFCEAAEQARSYIGCEYAVERLPNLIESPAVSAFAVVVANPDRTSSAEVSIRRADGSVATLRQEAELSPPYGNYGSPTTLLSEVLLADGSSIPMGETARDVTIPPRAAGVFLLDPGTNLRAYRITSNFPVVAYQFNPYCCNFTTTNDASLLLPTYTWGRRYRALGYPTMPLEDGVRPYLAVVTQVDATVTVDSPVPVRVLGRADVRGRAFTFDVTADETVMLEVDPPSTAQDHSREHDLSGLVLESDEPMAVFTGHPCTFVPQDRWACDHLEEQLLPADTLGNRYVLTPTRLRTDTQGDVTEATYWRLVPDADAHITFVPDIREIDAFPSSAPATPDCLKRLNDDGSLDMRAGDVCEFGARVPVALTSDAPLIVGGIISGHQSTGVTVYGTQAGDPSLFVLPPVEQFRTSYGFVTPPTFQRTYVSVALPAGEPLLFNGVGVARSDRLERRTVELGGRQWEVFSMAIEPGVHRLEAEQRFGIVVYAYDDYVSYAFTGGLDLLPKGARPSE